MRSKGNAPTAAQKRWVEAVANLGSIISGDPAQIHHCVGVTGKHNKVHIGPYWILPLTEGEHLALHAGLYGKCRRQIEKDLFREVLRKLEPDESLNDWPPQDVLNAIEDYHR